jgi:CheY-like chemotaxis protein
MVQSFKYVSAPDSRNYQIVILDDSEFDATLIQYELKKAGLSFEARWVDGRDDFLRTLRERTPDVILSDFHLPQFDGAEALRIAAEELPSTPFIFVSGKIGEERAVEMLRAGATDYVLKDRLSRLPAAVVSAVEKAEMQRSRRQWEDERLQAAADISQLLSIVSAGVLRADDEGRCTFVNETARRLLRLTLELESDFDVHAALHDVAVLNEDDCLVSGILHGDVRAATAESRVTRRDGSSFLAVVTGAKLLVAPGGAVFTLVDVTASRESQKRLERAERLASIGSVATTIVHELNNVLMGIELFTNLLERTARAEEKVQNLLGQIKQTLKRGRRVTQEVLSFAQNRRR